MKTFVQRIAKPLQSRKVRVALTTVVVAFLAEWGFDVSENVVFAIIGVGTAIILGIAHEDHGAKSMKS